MKRIVTSLEVLLPEAATDPQVAAFKADCAVIMRAVYEDVLHDHFTIALTETHKHIGNFSMTESESTND